MLLVVGRIGRAHGVRGEATIEIRTDNPDSRFAIGNTLQTDPSDKGPLTIRDARFHSGTLLLSFNGVDDRNGVEALRNVFLMADVNPEEANLSNDDFHISQIVGCQVLDSSAKDWGVVTDVLHLPAQDTLVINYEGREILVPFVKAFVPTIDVEKKVIIVNEIEGLL
ncbi:MAG: ribosome maturation factor RimM [Actinobacteria bacterium]|nr:ribosome maturation factor RimM [Actinomycetota bacterium]